MAGRQLNVSVLVSLIDRMTSPLTRMMGKIGGLGRTVGVLGSAIAAISFAAPIAKAAEWDSSIRGIGITAGLSGAALEEMIQRTSGNYEKLALDVGQFSRDIAGGAGLLVAAGMDPKQIEALLPIIGRVSTAADASFNDISQTAFALSDGLKVPADQMEQALAALVVAGKEGRFELADMAKYFPTLTAQMASLGVTGMEAVTTLASGLQVAMKGAADPSQAATNMQNFLAKLNSPETQRNFKKMGVDLSGVMQDAVAKGINPIEAVIEKVSTLAGVSAGDVAKAYNTAKKAGLSDADAFAKINEQIKKLGGANIMGQLFSDQQVLGFLLPMMANIAEYKRIRDEAGLASPDVIKTDFDSRMAGQQKKLERFSEIGEQVMRRVGRAFASNLGWISDGLDKMLAGVAWMDANFPGTIDTILSLAGGFSILVIGLGLLSPAITIISAGLGVMGAVLGVVASPLILVIALLAGAAALIMADWKNFAPFFTRMWNGIKTTFRGAIDGLKSLFRGDFAGFKRGMMTAWGGLKDAAVAGWGIISRVFGQIVDRIRAIDWLGTGKWIMNAIVAGIVALWSRVIDIGNEMADRIRSIDWKKVGRDISELVVAGLKALFDVAEQISRALVTFDWSKTGRAIVDTLVRAMMMVGNLASAVGGAIADALEGFDWGAVGRTIMQGIWDGMKQLGGAIAAWVKSLFDFGSWMPGAAPATPAAPRTDGVPTKSSFTPPVGGTNGMRQAANSNTFSGKLILSAEKGTRVRVADQSDNRVAFVHDRGAMLGRA